MLASSGVYIPCLAIRYWPLQAWSNTIYLTLPVSTELKAQRGVCLITRSLCWKRSVHWGDASGGWWIHDLEFYRADGAAEGRGTVMTLPLWWGWRGVKLSAGRAEELARAHILLQPTTMYYRDARNTSLSAPSREHSPHTLAPFLAPYTLFLPPPPFFSY
jgi:hypothetical protein